MNKLDAIAIQFYIDPSTNPIRQCARSAYRNRIVDQVRTAITAHAQTTRPLSLFNATINSCEYHATIDTANQITVARENKARADKRARTRRDWSEAV